MHGGLPETWLDADKVDQILCNLVENAVRHGAGIVTIVVEPARMDGEAALPAAVGFGAPDAVSVSVRDQGEGISPEVAPRVFRRFWRGKRRGGTGLGLYIVKGLVEAHGGTIGVRRAPGAVPSSDLSCPRGQSRADSVARRLRTTARYGNVPSGYPPSDGGRLRPSRCWLCGCRRGVSPTRHSAVDVGCHHRSFGTKIRRNPSRARVWYGPQEAGPPCPQRTRMTSRSPRPPNR